MLGRIRHSNTIKTIFGFLRSVLDRRVPRFARDENLDDIYNYLEIEGLFSTSGQPNEAQFRLIKRAGFKRVINLAPTSVLENSLIEEASILKSLDMDYVHIPVDFKNPTDDDFHRFVAALDNIAVNNVWVHCAANMRVSAFTYRYRTEILRHDQATAMVDLQEIWEPMGVWSKFIRR